MKIGYARVSTQEQVMDLQIDALTSFGCEQIFSEKMSGKSKDRPELIRCFQTLRKGDTLVVWRLDRLGRSLKELLELTAELKERDIAFVSVTEGFDTNNINGQLVFNIFASIAEFERNLHLERTQAGLKAARARGRFGGRKPKLSRQKAAQAFKLIEAGESYDAVAEIFDVNRRTLYRTFERYDFG